MVASLAWPWVLAKGTKQPKLHVGKNEIEIEAKTQEREKASFPSHITHHTEKLVESGRERERGKERKLTLTLCGADASVSLPLALE